MAGGRWNPIGIPMLYTAEHLSLACLEVLVHLDKSQLPRDYVWSRAELPAIPEALAGAASSSISDCQTTGGAWIRERTQLAVRAPSVIIPEEFNILLNPCHEGYGALTWGEPRPFRFDPRLFAAEPHTL